MYLDKVTYMFESMLQFNLPVFQFVIFEYDKKNNHICHQEENQQNQLVVFFFILI